ncbi:hypothetical protein WDW89_15970 [Deltaproteobacteria bacterium TL4]
MALNPFAKKKKPVAVQIIPDEKTEVEMLSERGLISLFYRGIEMQAEREDLLKKSFEEGNTFFQEFNNTRMQLAFENFGEDMKKALYEILFFLHVNDPKYSEVKYTGIEIEHIYGIEREHEYETSSNLYLESAPHGVKGIDNLPEIFRERFFEYIQSEFNTRPSEGSVKGICPFVSISSLGSIGTVGHKPIVSDLDIQVQYELDPFCFDLEDWNDERIILALKKEIQSWMSAIRRNKKIPAEKLQDPEVKKELQKMANGQVRKAFPQLFKYLLLKEGEYRQELKKPDGTKLRQMFLHEMMDLIKRNHQKEHAEEQKNQHELIKQRVNTIQDYIQRKFPKAEIYMFLCDNVTYRKGYHGTTLESKEASGSAYEFILTYDVLMPGIQFTPMIPTHFILPKIINDSPAFYERTLDYIRYGAIHLYKDYAEMLVNLGSTPRLKLRYILAHGGAIYWESFKASSGNLAKALLNLFRIEMLHEPKYLIMIIEIIKEPNVLNEFIKEPTPEERADKEKPYGLRLWELLEMEQTHGLLPKDPWWVKYKILKIAFGNLEYLQAEERQRISRIIDLCFGLHIKVSEVFVKPGDTRVFASYREKFLVDFLNRAFPPGSTQRTFLEHVNIGETKAVIEFESEMKELFKASLERVLDIETRHGIPDESNQNEFKIWYHYYQKNFEPPRNMVRRSILHHLKVPRLRLQARYEEKSKLWKFRSLQTESKLGKRFDTFGVLDDLPDEVDLTTSSSFLYSLADCILNSYYGYVNRGSLKEQKTAFEFDSASMKIKDPVDSRLAYVRPDNIMRLSDKITEFFVYRTYHYLDCIQAPKHYLEIFFIYSMMRFGRLSILYRDNLTNWYLDEYDHKELKIMASHLAANYQDTFKNKAFHTTIARFLSERKISLKDEKVKTAFWFNPNSAETTHSATKVVEKEDDLAKIFRNAVYGVHAK